MPGFAGAKSTPTSGPERDMTGDADRTRWAFDIPIVIYLFIYLLFLWGFGPSEVVTSELNCVYVWL